MKKSISIFFLAVFLFSTTPQLFELLKLPLLLEHFKEHKQWDHDISVFGFMFMHYVHDDNKYGDQDRDMQMPFKTLSHSEMTTVSFVAPFPNLFIIPQIICKEQKQKLFYDCSAYSSLYLSNIWQPPKSC